MYLFYNPFFNINVFEPSAYMYLRMDLIEPHKVLVPPRFGPCVQYAGVYACMCTCMVAQHVYIIIMYT